jgi:hypothetical protein
MRLRRQRCGFRSSTGYGVEHSDRGAPGDARDDATGGVTGGVPDGGVEFSSRERWLLRQVLLLSCPGLRHGLGFSEQS